MITIKIIFDNGEYDITSFTGVLEEAKQFYLGRYFNFRKIAEVEAY
jgi:hypothetical protein